jgi:hypothetical protein
MSHLQPRDWEHLIERAETEPDLQKVRGYLEDVETAVVLHGIDRFKTPNGHVDATDLRRISDRLLKLKRDRLKWPEPFIGNQSDG